MEDAGCSDARRSCPNNDHIERAVTVGHFEAKIGSNAVNSALRKCNQDSADTTEIHRQHKCGKLRTGARSDADSARTVDIGGNPVSTLRVWCGQSCEPIIRSIQSQQFSSNSRAFRFAGNPLCLMP
jgi:hypothetical protein